MKRGLQQILLPGIFFGSLLWGTGCYTQFGTTRDQVQEEYTSAEDDTTGDNYEQTYTGDSYDNENFAPGYRYGFDYYYPTLAFSFSTYDPWYWRYGGWYSYDPFWCGTYYPSIYAGWHYWYPPVFYGYPHYGYHNYGYAGGRGSRGTTRTIGNTRGRGTVAVGGRNEVGSRGSGSSPADLPTGYRSATGTRGTPPANTPRVSTGRSSNTGSRSGTRGTSGVRGGNSRGASSGETRTETPRTYTPPPRDRNSDRGSTGRSYSPPPPPPPQQSPPPRSNGGSSGSSGGTRGGRGR